MRELLLRNIHKVLDKPCYNIGRILKYLAFLGPGAPQTILERQQNKNFWYLYR